MDEVIFEPNVDASSCSFYSDMSEPIQYFYKLKYPDVYSLHCNTIFELLDSEPVDSELKNSVKSFINQVRQSYKSNRTIGAIKTNCVAEKDIIPIYDNKWRTFTINADKSCYEKSADLFKVSTPQTDFSLYDSVHSIKVPLRSYENKSRQNKQRRLEVSSGSRSSVAEVIQKMNGLVFDRVEKTVPIPPRYTNIHSSNLLKRKERPLKVSMYSRKPVELSTSIRKPK